VIAAVALPNKQMPVLLPPSPNAKDHSADTKERPANMKEHLANAKEHPDVKERPAKTKNLRKPVLNIPMTIWILFSVVLN
jgi:hypothetical protein